MAKKGLRAWVKERLGRYCKKAARWFYPNVEENLVDQKEKISKMRAHCKSKSDDQRAACGCRKKKTSQSTQALQTSKLQHLQKKKAMGGGFMAKRQRWEQCNENRLLNKSRIFKRHDACKKQKNFRPTKSGAGMTRAGVKAYRRLNPGSKLKTAVTGKVKPGSKAAKRRKSYCARSLGQLKRASAKTRNDPNSRIRQARRRWKC